MGFFKEMPFYTPNERGKLFKRHTFDGEIKVGDSKEAVTAQLSNFVNYKSIKWIMERRLESGRFVPVTNMAVDETSMYIKSNTLEEISQGDVLWLRNGLFPKGEYFIVSGPVEQEFGGYPKQRKTYIHIPLTLIYGNPNN